MHLRADRADDSGRERLAGNVGNGGGLYDYLEIQSTLWTLPPQPPAGLTLGELVSLTPADLGISAAGLETEMGAPQEPQAAAVLSQLTRLLPRRFIVASYRDEEGEEWGTVACEYPSGNQAWLNWGFVRVILQGSGAKTTETASGDGIFLMEEDVSMVISREGPYLVISGGPAQDDASRLVELTDALQL